MKLENRWQLTTRLKCSLRVSCPFANHNNLEDLRGNSKTSIRDILYFILFEKIALSALSAYAATSPP